MKDTTEYEAMPILQELKKVMKPAVGVLKDFDGLVRVISHYDADGIASAGIIATALIKEKKRFRLSFVKGVSPQIFQEIEHEGLVIIADMGSGQIESIRKMDATVIIIDHHITPEIRKKKKGFENFSPEEGEKGKIFHYNTGIFGIDGGAEGCASSMSLAFVLSISEINSSLTDIALAGIIGDKQDEPLTSLNREVVDMGISMGYIQEKRPHLFLDGDSVRDALIYSVDPYLPGLTGREQKVDAFLKECGIDGTRSPEDLNPDEMRFLTDRLMLLLLKRNATPEGIEGMVRKRYYLRRFGRYADTLSNQLNACGRLDRMTTGVAVCLGEKTAMEKAVKIREKYRSTLRNGLIYLESRGIRKLRNIQYFMNNDPSSSGAFAGLGMLYLFDRHMPVVALSKKENKTHISSRGTRELVGKGLDLSDAMRYAAGKVGGSGGGHAVAAGATIPAGKEKEFLETVDEIVGKQLTSNVSMKN